MIVKPITDPITAPLHGLDSLALRLLAEIKWMTLEADLSCTRTGSRNSIFPNGGTVAANTVDHYTYGGIPLAGVMNSGDGYGEDVVVNSSPAWGTGRGTVVCVGQPNGYSGNSNPVSTQARFIQNSQMIIYQPGNVLVAGSGFAPNLVVSGSVTDGQADVVFGILDGTDLIGQWNDATPVSGSETGALAGALNIGCRPTTGLPFVGAVGVGYVERTLSATERGALANHIKSRMSGLELTAI